MPDTYTIVLQWSAADAAWIATVPDLDGCITHGETPADAVAQVQDAAKAWVETATAQGYPVPPVTYRPLW